MVALNLSAITAATSFPWYLLTLIEETKNPIYSALFWASDPWSQAHWPNPESITGDNEDDQGYGGIHLHDPSIIQYNNTFYSYTTRDLMRISSAPTLNGYWTEVGTVIARESRIDIPGRANPWAPEVHYINNTFYCFYSVSERGSHLSAIGVATSTNPVTDWFDHGELFRSDAIPKHTKNPPVNAIDPSFLLDPVSNTPYLTFGSFFGGIWQTQLTPDLMSVVPGHKAVRLLGGDALPDEGSFLSYRDGWYYLWFSHGICCSLNLRKVPPGHEYSIRVGRSTKASGPFLDRNGVPLLNGGYFEVFGSHGEIYAPGGEGVLTLANDGNFDGDGTGWNAAGTAEGRDVLYYHYFNKTQGIADKDVLLGWNYIEYVGGWPVLVPK